MRVLGAVLAGGRSRRFGSDKADALIDGRSLITRAIAAAAGQCDAWVVCGRAGFGEASIADRPHADLGPLGGLAAALHAASTRGFDAVLSIPCDVPNLPTDLRACFERAGPPAYLKNLPVAGLWPGALAAGLDAFLAETADRSLRAWTRGIDATPVDLDQPLANINTRDDLAAYVDAGDRECGGMLDRVTGFEPRA